ncbi:hypothetical protein IPN35_04665 [Candidatus Peregrinibacteria bacterium]|nr:MAG: hypothetical protein IPN35_04665 [Candidatus Peregrinibacteria bacterium]
MTNLSQKITAQIKKRHIRQWPRLYFVLKNTAFWLLFSLSVLVGAIAFSVILYALIEADFEVLRYASSSAVGFFLATLPLYWMFFFGLFLLIALFGFRKTKKGYRIPLVWLLFGNITLSILFGFVFFRLIGAEIIEATLARAMPFYTRIEHQRRDAWSHPREGFLAGVVTRHSPEKHILIVNDFSTQDWEVSIDDVEFVHPLVMALIEENEITGRQIKVLGNPTGENTFHARSLLPWRREQHGAGMEFRENMPPPPHMMRDMLNE